MHADGGFFEKKFETVLTASQINCLLLDLDSPNQEIKNIKSFGRPIFVGTDNSICVI